MARRLGLVDVASEEIFGAGYGRNRSRRKDGRDANGAYLTRLSKRDGSVGLGCHQYLLHPDPRIDDTVEDVDDEVAQDRHHGDDEYDPQKDREVASLG